ncbi:MOSC domain-containing protein [Nocardioides sp. URHA0020]|uniref:MOSC domain-containing protein n=1 Tax=Nocardioides sp. URHA0020 TaxID=1380392 RepID=UPI00048A7B8B|nr:MOSC domain-containing protein [Nocardioides sp. URHA0020]
MVPLSPSLVSVNVGRPRVADWAEIGRTSISKHPVAGAVQVGPLGLDGDQVSDRRHHGGLDQAVYAFAREDLDWWAGELGQEIPDGQFGENLTTHGIDVNEAEIGERWQIGEVLLEVRSIRTPCNDFKAWMGRSGYDNAAWVRRFAQVARPGPYLKVLGVGELRSGEEISVLHTPGHGVTVSLMFRALHGEPELLPRLLDVPDLVPKARARVAAYAAARS